MKDRQSSSPSGRTASTLAILGLLALPASGQQREYLEAHVHPDGKMAIVLMNLADHEEILQLWVEGRTLKYTSPVHGIITMIL